jgi:hypothetical protein
MTELGVFLVWALVGTSGAFGGHPQRTFPSRFYKVASAGGASEEISVIGRDATRHVPFASVSSTTWRLGRKSTIPHPLNMGHGETLPMLVHIIIIRLSDILRAEDIAFYTSIPLRSVQRILGYYRLTGAIKGFDPKDLTHEIKVGRRQQLCTIELQVSIE